jgi:tetraacyldisaccharide 4'-kinase
MERYLTEVWYRDKAPPAWLQPLAALYRLAVETRSAAYARGWLVQQSAGKPVVVVGNLTVGGTGKTPLVAWLAGQVSGWGLKVGVVSRGYGRTGRAPQDVHVDSPWRDVGDEPLLLKRLTGCDVIVARDRVAGAQELVRRGADIVIADDGLQHRRLARDCDIIVVDGVRGFGNQHLLPAGPLREPVAQIAGNALIVVNGAPEHTSLRDAAKLIDGAFQMTLAASEAHRLDEVEGPQPLERFRGQSVHAVAGIGNPGRFFRDLRSWGIDVVEHPFRDHHPFTASDLDFGDARPVLMTEKDAVRCRTLASARMWYVPVSARFSDTVGRDLLEGVLRTIGAPIR